MKNAIVKCIAVAASVASAFTVNADVALTSANFPDANFLSYLKTDTKLKADANGDGVLSDTEIANIKEISVSSKGITTLQGIEYFTALSNLSCGYNSLTELDLSQNTKLTEVYCSSNKSMTSLTIGNNPNLKNLYCSWCSIKSLDLNQCTALTSLNCECQKLQTLKIDNCENLLYIYAGWTEVTNDLDFTKYPKLLVLDAPQCIRTAPNPKMDITNCPKLTRLICWNNNLKELDLTNCPMLTHIECNANNGVKYINVDNCPELTYLKCTSTGLSSLNVDKNPELRTLICSWNKIPELNVDQNRELIYLDCRNNVLPELNVDQNSELIYLDCSNNVLPKLNVAQNSKLSYLNCSINKIPTLDVSNNSKLYYLSCGSNDNIPSLNLDNNTLLQYLYCSSNKISKLDLKKHTKLIEVYCSDNLLSELDLSSAQNLKMLSLSENNVEEINVSNNTQLRYLNCSKNYKIRSIDVTNCPDLGKYYSSPNSSIVPAVGLDYSYNQVSSIDLSKCPYLVSNISASYKANNNVRRINVHRYYNKYEGNVHYILLDELNGSNDQIGEALGEKFDSNMLRGWVKGLDNSYMSYWGNPYLKLEVSDANKVAGSENDYYVDYNYKTKLSSAEGLTAQKYVTTFRFIWSPDQEFHDDPMTGVEDVDAENVKVYGKAGAVCIEGTDDVAAVYNAAGQLVYNGTDRNIGLDCGMYIVKLSGKTYKVIVK